MSWRLHWFRTVFFLIPCISVYTIVLGTLSVLSTVVDRRGHAAHWCARAWSWLILATTGVTVTVEGLDRVQRDRTYVFISNHQSIYDIPVLFASLPFQLRIIAKESLGRFPFLGWHLIRAGHLLVDRSNLDHVDWTTLSGDDGTLGTQFDNVDIASVQAVPEPATAGSMLAGLLVLGAWASRGRVSRAPSRRFATASTPGPRPR